MCSPRVSSRPPRSPHRLPALLGSGGPGRRSGRPRPPAGVREGTGPLVVFRRHRTPATQPRRKPRSAKLATRARQAPHVSSRQAAPRWQTVGRLRSRACDAEPAVVRSPNAPKPGPVVAHPGRKASARRNRQAQARRSKSPRIAFPCFAYRLDGCHHRPRGRCTPCFTCIGYTYVDFWGAPQ